MPIIGDEPQPRASAQTHAQPPAPPSERPLRKSPAAFRTIAEVAGELDLPAHVLRFWESKFPQVKPLKRRGGRRYYRPEDIDLLRQIRTLLYTDGYTIRGVQRLLKEAHGRPSPGGDITALGAPAGLAAGEIDLEAPDAGDRDPPDAAAGTDAAASPEAGAEAAEAAVAGRGDDALADLLDELEAIRGLLARHGF
jgi:DNA-binding transcriptional MerR regulator